MIYRVTATMHGKRIATSKTFATKAEARSVGVGARLVKVANGWRVDKKY